MFDPLHRQPSPRSRRAPRLPHALTQWLGRAGVEFQFNATNLLQQKDYTLVRRDPDGQLFRATVNAPTNYALSARFSF